MPESVSQFSGKSVRGGVVGARVTGPALTPLQGAVPAAPIADVETQNLKVVSTDRVSGGRRTIFEVAPNRRVTLNEIETMQLSAAVATRVTGAQSTPAAVPTVKSGIASGQVSTPSGRSAAALSAVIRQDTSAEPVASSTASSLSNTIRWTDPVTRKLMVLSGPFTVEELQVLRAQIERQRADSARKD